MKSVIWKVLVAGVVTTLLAVVFSVGYYSGKTAPNRTTRDEEIAQAKAKELQAHDARVELEKKYAMEQAEQLKQEAKVTTEKVTAKSDTTAPKLRGGEANPTPADTSLVN